MIDHVLLYKLGLCKIFSNVGGIQPLTNIPKQHQILLSHWFAKHMHQEDDKSMWASWVLFEQTKSSGECNIWDILMCESLWMCIKVSITVHSHMSSSLAQSKWNIRLPWIVLAIITYHYNLYNMCLYMWNAQRTDAHHNMYIINLYIYTHGFI